MPSEGQDHDSRCRLAGPLARQPATAEYRAEPRGGLRAPAHRIGAALLTALAPPIAGALLIHLLWPTRWTGQGAWPVVADSASLLVACLAELVLLVHAAAVVHAALVAGDPAPAAPLTGTRAAFLVTYVPGAEALSGVRATLEGAVRMRPPGPLDVWLLDEGDDPEARMLCAELGVHHFTRLGVPEWNTETGPHRAWTRHGNLNAWLAKHGGDHDLLVSVAPGYVPLPELLERMTGHFRDPSVAFVVGPEAGRGGGAALTGAAGSGRRLRALVQRAGNRYGTPLLDGAATAVRIEALRRAGGFRDSAAGDLATGFEMHRLRDPDTGGYQGSVRIPEVVVVATGDTSAARADTSGRRPGEAYGALLRSWAGELFTMPPGRLLACTLTLLRRPVALVTWLLAGLSLVVACTHTGRGLWAVLPVLAALVPTAVHTVAVLRDRARRRAVPRPGTARPAKEKTALATTPAGGN
ncbi:glycosyl transferase [Streptomyces sp. NPDC047973]|uniref:glycosyl transferase n=1 Tax=Streptomyces sp. NPDC047973 TaxID=3155383 RepID=UPI003445191A